MTTSPSSNHIKLKYAKLAYQYLLKNFIPFLLIIPTTLAFLLGLLQDPNILQPITTKLLELNLIASTCTLLTAVLISTIYYISRPKPIFLINYACHTPPHSCRVPFSKYMEHINHFPFFNQNSVNFQKRILERSGFGEETCIPPASHYLPPRPSIQAAREEAELVMFSAIDNLFEKSRLRPKDIDILVVNCSLFSPTPSLSDMIVNKYKLGSDVHGFNLSGMGCGAGLISIGLAQNLLQVRKNSNALVVCTEILTKNYYYGNERSMLLPNCLFRMGASAIWLSNKRKDGDRAMYRLLHLVRTHKGVDDKAYRCVYEEEDADGKTGVSLQKDLMIVAGQALRSNITTIGPLVLPMSEQILFLLTLVGKKIINPNWKTYIPDFKQAFEHFCIHAGGRAVIDELQKNLQLSEEHVEASRMTLHRFGNTSSSSLWYELNYIESKGRMKRGDRVWQIGFGSGFKCNSAVWKCMRSVGTPVEGPWAGCVHRYPVDIPDIIKL